MNQIKSLFVGSLLALGLMASVAQGQNYTFFTIAGGTQGSNDGVNTSAQFYNPAGVAVDGAGNIYVADKNNNLIREVSPQGNNWVTTTLAGSARGSADGAFTNAQFSAPTGIAVDSATNLYIADQFNYTIRKMTESGGVWTVSTIAGQAGVFGTNDGMNTAALFHNPTALAIDGSGNIFVADEFNDNIREITFSGGNWITTTIAGSGTNGYTDGSGTSAKFYDPSAIAVDGSGRLFVTDLLNNLIRMVVPNEGGWTVSTIAGNLELNAGANNGLGTAASFDLPIGIAIDNSGNLYITEAGNNDVRKLTPDAGNWETSTIGGGVSGLADGTGTNAEFFMPFGVAVDSHQNVYVGDSQNNAVRYGVAGTGGLTVTITPSSAVTAGAEWQVDNGAFLASGATASGLIPGNHVITFKDVSGFTTPAEQTVSVTALETASATGNYTTAAVNAGSLQVTLSPETAVTDGAEWQLDGGAFQTNGAVLTDVSVGEHTLSFSNIVGWTAPPSQTVEITNDETTAVTGIYTTNTSNYTLTVNAASGGTVSGGGSFEAGTTTNIKAIAGSGFQFVGWAGDVAATNNPLTVTVTTNLTYTAYFAVTGSATLIIVTNGEGSVSPDLAGRTLTLNRTYPLTARPATGSVFSNWTGSIVTNKNPLNVKLTGPMFLQANFVVNPFPDVLGVYNGLFYEGEAITENTAGMLKNLTVNKNGAYTGTLFFNGGAHPIAGKFSLGGQATNKIARTVSAGGPVQLVMTLDLSSTPTEVTGSVTGTNSGVPFAANLLADAADDTLPAAEYTLLVKPDTNNAPPTNSPGGESYALITNVVGRTAALGTARITGNLADGTAITETVPVSAQGYVPVYANLYGGTGLLMGWLNLNLTNVTDFGLTWIHPARNTGLYRGGFTNIVSTNGILLAKWTNSPATLSAMTNLTIVPVTGTTNGAAHVLVSISSTGKITGVATTGTVNLKTGLLKVTSGTGANKISGTGAVLINSATGGGYYLNKTEGQAIELGR